MSTARIVVTLEVKRPGIVNVTVIDPNGEIQDLGAITSPAQCVSVMPQIAAHVALMLGVTAVELVGESA